MSATPTKVVVICGSCKPAPGIDRPSAARELLKPVLAGIARAGATASVFDLRDMVLPFFDGRTGEQYDCPDLDRLTTALSEATTVFLAVPAYWQAPSGPLVNLLNILGGAAYDRTPGSRPPFEGKTAVQLVVGADPSSGYLAAAISRSMLASLGFLVSPRETVVANPRAVRDVQALTKELRELGAHAAGPTAERTPGSAEASGV